jgi:hypothetical protein
MMCFGPLFRQNRVFPGWQNTLGWTVIGNDEGNRLVSQCILQNCTRIGMGLMNKTFFDSNHSIPDEPQTHIEQRKLKNFILETSQTETPKFISLFGIINNT